MPEKQYFQSLVNFNNCVQIKDLYLKMGVTEFPKIQIPSDGFKREVSEIKKIIEVSPEDQALEEKITTSEIDLAFDEIEVNQEGFLTFSGRKVVAYIRDQPHVDVVHYGADPDRRISGYKYHLCNCKTLQNMTAEGRERRYFITKRTDGLFYVNCLTGPHSKIEEAYVSMQLCGNCRTMLFSMGIPIIRLSLKNYFEMYESYVPKTITRYETSTHVQDYSHDHAAVATTCRKAVDYTCQKCGVRCDQHRQLLHLHHRNGIKSDNFLSNLLVLCADCHSLEFMHEHLKKQLREQIDQILKLRKEQGILDLTKL